MSLIIDARAASYSGEAVRIIAATDTKKGIILIQDMAKWSEPTKFDANTVIVTDTPTVFDHWQLCFDEAKHMQTVMRAYQTVRSAGLIRLKDTVRRYDPTNVIQMRKIDERGRVEEFDSSSINNGHLAVLLAVWASRTMYGGNIITMPDVPAVAQINGQQADNDDDDMLLPMSN